VLATLTADANVGMHLWRVREQCSLLQMSDAVMTKEEQSQALDNFAAVLNGGSDIPLRQSAQSGSADYDVATGSRGGSEDASEESRPRKRTRKLAPVQVVVSDDEESDALFELEYLQSQDFDANLSFSPRDQPRQLMSFSDSPPGPTALAPPGSMLSACSTMMVDLSSDEEDL
jgi:hypothetical protein